jgi:hypothetical protein
VTGVQTCALPIYPVHNVHSSSIVHKTEEKRRMIPGCMLKLKDHLHVVTVRGLLCYVKLSFPL